MQPGEVKKYEVFVTQLCDGNIKNAVQGSDPPNLDQIKNIINQLIDGLEQLESAGKSHNDIKPGNILYKKHQNGFEIKIGDFGQAGKLGGTPGWTAPIFHNRQPGKEDVYSMGLVILWLLCEIKDLFYMLRDNFIEDSSKQWLNNFRTLPEIQFITKMIDLNNPISVDEVRSEWNKIASKLKLISVQRMLNLGYPIHLFNLQYDHYRYIYDLVNLFQI